MRGLTAQMQTGVQATTVYPILIAEIQTKDGYVRAWTGIGDLSWNGNTYNGVGNFGGVSAINETSDLQANGVKFALSGIDSNLLQIALAGIRHGLPAKLWFGLLDSSNALIPDPYLLFQGLTDVPEINEGVEASVISLSAENRLIDLERARTRRYTIEDQQIEYPADLGFEYVASLQDKEIRFGR